MPRFVSPETKAEIVRRYANGGEVIPLAREFGVHRKSVTNWLEEFGIPLRAQVKRPKQSLPKGQIKQWPSGISFV